jgi:hypothetical protein
LIDGFLDRRPPVLAMPRDMPGAGSVNAQKQTDIFSGGGRDGRTKKRRWKPPSPHREKVPTTECRVNTAALDRGQMKVP